jgi:hypothetical protein
MKTKPTLPTRLFALREKLDELEKRHMNPLVTERLYKLLDELDTVTEKFQKAVDGYEDIDQKCAEPAIQTLIRARNDINMAIGMIEDDGLDCEC